MKFLVSLILALAPGLAQNLFVLPALTGSPGTTNDLAVSYVPSTLTQNGQFVVGTGAYRVVSNTDGSKFYVISNNPHSPLLSVTNNFNVVTTVSGVYAPISQAVMSLDGSVLYVISAGTLSAFKVADDSPIELPTLPINQTVLDVDVSVDASQVFVLITSSFANTLEALSGSTFESLATIPLPASPSAVTVGPNALVYVSAPGAILEIDPNYHTVLRQYSVSGTPGKLAFTPDGHYLLANNVSTEGATVLTVVDLEGHAVVGSIPNSALPAGTVLSTIWTIKANEALAWAQATQQVYTITIAPLAVQPAAFIPSGKALVGVAVSADIAFENHTTTQYVYWGTNTTLQQVDLSSGQSTGVFTPDVIEAISYAAHGPSGLAAGLVQYGNNQQVTPGAVSQPLVVRVLDAGGNAVYGVSVTFQGSSGVTINTPAAISNTAGYASTTFVAPAAPGPVTIQAQAQNFTATFDATVGSSGSGGTPASLTVVQGQGQIASEVTRLSINGSPLAVQVKDTNGNAVQGTLVNFNLTQGSGILALYQGIGQQVGLNSLVVPTDKNGMAAIDMVTALVPAYPSFDQEVITASLDSGISAPIYVTTFAQSVPAVVYRVSPEAGTTFSGTVGSTIKGAFQFKIFSTTGPGIPNVSMQLLPAGDPSTTPTASCAGTPLSNSQGIVTCDLVFGGRPGSAVVTPQIGYFALSLPFPINVSVGAPAQFVKKQGDGQSALPGQKLQAMVAQLQDEFGNPLPNTMVTWQVTSGSATITQATTATDSNAYTLAYVTLGSVSGPVQVTVSAGSPAAPAVANFTATVAAIPGGLAIVSGNNQAALVSGSFSLPLVVEATDNQNNPIPGVSVAFAVTLGSAILSASSATTDSSGNASVTLTAGTIAGPVNVTASYSVFTTTFTLAVNPPVTFVNGASFQVEGAAPGAIAPGEIVTILGDGLTPGVTGIVTPPPGPLPTTLAGVEVLFGGVAAPLFAVVNLNGQEQINVLAPFELGSTKTTSVTIINSAGSITILNLPVQPLAPGFFETYYADQRTAVLRHASNGHPVTPQDPALPEESVTALVTGLGQGTPNITSDAAGASQKVQAPLTVSVNGISIVDVSGEYERGAYGVYLATFAVPSGLQPGLYPLVLSATGPDTNTYQSQSSFIPVGALSKN